MHVMLVTKFLTNFVVLTAKDFVVMSYNIDNWIFTGSWELRGVFGIMIGQIAKAYGIDVEDELAQIIPE